MYTIDNLTIGEVYIYIGTGFGGDICKTDILQYTWKIFEPKK